MPVRCVGGWVGGWRGVFIKWRLIAWLIMKWVRGGGGTCIIHPMHTRARDDMAPCSFLLRLALRKLRRRTSETLLLKSYSRTPVRYADSVEKPVSRR
jgi:hypothetical protein